jgi:predicted LPLAT superfamily acyltransferase
MSQNVVATRKKLWQGKTMGAAPGHLAIIKTARFIPRWATGIAIFPIILFFHFCVRSSHAGSRSYLALRYNNPGFIKRNIFSLMRTITFGRIILDKIYLTVRGPDYFSVDFPHTGLIRNALAEKRGLILLSAHIGAWDVVSRFFTRFGSKVNVVMYEAERREIKTLYEKNAVKKELPYATILSNDPLDALIQIKAALGRGEIVVMHGDRSAGAQKQHMFLGKMANFPLLPYAIASKIGAPIAVAVGIRTGYCAYQARVYRPFSLPEDKIRAIHEGLSGYIAALEDMVQRYPLQWFNYYEFWEQV